MNPKGGTSGAPGPVISRVDAVEGTGTGPSVLLEHARVLQRIARVDPAEGELQYAGGAGAVALSGDAAVGTLPCALPTSEGTIPPGFAELAEADARAPDLMPLACKPSLAAVVTGDGGMSSGGTSGMLVPEF